MKKICCLTLIVFSMSAGLCLAEPPVPRGADGPPSGPGYYYAPGLKGQSFTQAYWTGWKYVDYVNQQTDWCFVVFTDGTWVGFTGTKMASLAAMGAAALVGGRPMYFEYDEYGNVYSVNMR